MEEVKKSYGYGSGYGDGYGYGYGDGDDSGISIFCGYSVHFIDGIATLINHIHGNIAKGMILHTDMTTEPCYVCKQGSHFAHGATLREAMNALQDKLFEDMPEDERIEEFWLAFELDRAYPNRMFFEWHHKLTGSCEQGRRAFAKDNGLTIDSGETTTREFIKLTLHAGFGDEIIQRVAERYGIAE